MSTCNVEGVAQAIVADEKLAGQVASASELIIRSGQINDIANMRRPIAARSVRVYHRGGTPMGHINEQPNLTSVEEICVVLSGMIEPHPDIAERIVVSLTRFSTVPISKLTVESHGNVVPIHMRPLLETEVGGRLIKSSLRHLKLSNVSLVDMGAPRGGTNVSLELLELENVSQFLGLVYASVAKQLVVHSTVNSISKEEAQWISVCGQTVVLRGILTEEVKDFVRGLRHVSVHAVRRPPGYRANTIGLREAPGEPDGAQTKKHRPFMSDQ